MAEFYIVPKFQNDLEHHGVKGQKWGVRRYQNYDGTRIGAKSRGSSGSKTSEQQGTKLNRTGIDPLTASILTYTLIDINAKIIFAGKHAVEKAMFRRKYDYTNQTNTDWADEKTMSVYKSVRDKQRKSAEKIKSESDVKRKESETTAEEDMKAVNPNKRNKDYASNCMYCSVAFDLRRRGYDVRANARRLGGNDSEIKEWYSDAKPQAYKSAKETLDAARSQPEGSRGCLSGTGPWGGHELAYEVKNGKLNLYDAQNGKKFKESEFNKYYAMGTVTRLDDAKPNWNTIGETLSDDSVKNAG